MKIQIFIQTYIKTNFNQMEKIMNNKRNDNKDDLSEFKIAFDFPELASEPAVGSVKQYEPNHSPDASLGKYFCFCSSLPNR